MVSAHSIQQIEENCLLPGTWFVPGAPTHPQNKFRVVIIRVIWTQGSLKNIVGVGFL